MNANRNDAPFSVLVIDDEAQMCDSLKRLLQKHRFVVHVAHSAREGLLTLQRCHADLILCDIVMPDMSGLLFIEKVGRRVPVIMMTAYASVETARRAFKLGASDYLVKPFDFDELLVVIKQNLSRHLGLPSHESRSRCFDSRDPAYRQMLQTALTFSDTDMPILIQGESGTGKEVVAEYIHESSRRAARPFLRINCAAIPETLLESELFGYEKGAFTGAFEQKKGKFEEAEGGTVFLDEIGDMPLPLQAKMLRFLQDFEFYRLGSRKPLVVDVRVIAATNQNIEQLIEAGGFRADLYHRLNGISLRIPPVRERPEDIESLASFWLAQFNKKYGKHVQGISREALAVLKGYPWPGNIRELRNCIERSLVVCQGEQLGVDHLPDGILRSPQPAAGPEGTQLQREVQEYRERYTRHVIIEALKKTGGNRVEAARLLNISRKTLYNRMKELQIRHEFS